MKTKHVAAAASMAFVLSGSARAEQHGQDMVNVVIGTVVPVPIDQAATGCGSTVDEMRSHMADVQPCGPSDTAATAGRGGDAGGTTGGDAGEVEAAENTGGVTGTGPGGDTGAMTGSVPTELNIVCLIGPEAVARAGLPADEAAGQ